jgi:hypothetical protein
LYGSHAAGGVEPDWQKPAQEAITQVCANKSFTSLANNKQSCKLWGDAEVKDFGFDLAKYTSAQPSISLIPQGSNLPHNVSSGGGTSRGLALVSPACNGRVVARAVFKSIQQPQKTSRAAGIRFLPFTNASLINASPVIRCLLTLDEAKTGLNETQKALVSKEDKCYVCDESSGCPANEGSWYSDAFTFDVPGCKDTASLPYPVYVQLVMSTGWEALLAKAEVCNSFGCFDPDYEAGKVKNAARCTEQEC